MFSNAPKPALPHLDDLEIDSKYSSGVRNWLFHLEPK